MDEKLENNKRMLREFVDMMSKPEQLEDAVNKYLGDAYIQHDPIMPAGREGCRKFHEDMYKEYPDMRVEIKRIVAEGDLVVLHNHMIRHEGDLGLALIEIFRVDNNKLVEHWCAVQDVPETSVNDNTMF